MADTIFGMPMDDAEARYLAQQRTPAYQGDTLGQFANYLPNIFGGNPAQVAGLLGEEQAGQISRQANVNGLLGAAIALANGMSPQGYRRSAAQNILTALGAGMQSSQGAYQNAVQQAMAGQRMAKDSAEAQLAQMRGYAELQKAQAEAEQQRRYAAVQQKIANGEPLNDADYIVLDKSKYVDAKLRQPTNPHTVTFPDGSLKQWNPQTNTWDVVGNAAEKAAFSGEYQNLSLAMFGTADVTKLNPQQRTAVDKEAERRGIAKANAVAPKVAVNTSDPTAVTKAVMDVSKDFSALTKDDREVRSRYDQLHSAYKNPALGGSGDAAMIYSVAKILDPTGAVREGDIETIAGNRSYPDQLRGLAQKFINNQRLTERERDQLMSLGYQITAQRSKNAEYATSQYRGYASNFGIKNPEQQIRNPYEGFAKPQYRLIRFNNKEMKAQLSPKDGKYYVESGGKFYPVED